jgi:hypothetical protein
MAPIEKSKIIRIVIAFILVAAFAFGTHAFFVARSENASAPCINNLRIIVSAKSEWAFENGKTTNDVPTWNDLRPYLPETWSNGIPVCPDGGRYTIGRIGRPPTCSIGGRNHTLPAGEGQ